jgi:hypothetical protein
LKRRSLFEESLVGHLEHVSAMIVVRTHQSEPAFAQ